MADLDWIPVKPSSDFKTDFFEHLEQIAFFLEYNDENPFKIRAFKAAPELLEGLSSEELQTKIREKTLLEIKGIGKGIFSIAQNFLASRTSPELKAAIGDLPLSLLELREIKGLGPKKIRALAENLQIKSLGELEYACLENRLVSLKGFGEKTQEKILKEIEMAKTRRGKLLLSDALKTAEKIEMELGKKITFKRVGDLGRKLEIVDKMEYLIQTPKPQKLLQELKGYSLVQNLEVSKEEAQLKVEGGENIGFHFSSPEHFIVESIFRTSSDKHWKSLESAAKKSGLVLTSTQLFKNKDEIKLTSETDFYKNLKLSFYPPEAREFEASSSQNHLCEENDLTGIFHLHTTYSDGLNSVEEMATACQKMKWNFMGISDHSKTAVYAQGLDEERLAEQWKEIDSFNAKSKNFKIFKGIESDILKDGKLDYADSVLKKFDFMIGSIHTRYGMTEMTERIIKAIENPHTTMIGHLSGRLLLARAAYDFDSEKIFDAAIANKKIIELNANPHRLDIDWRQLYKACDRGLLISINPDAHSIQGLQDFRYGIWMSHKALVPKEQIFNTWPIEKIENYLLSR